MEAGKWVSGRAAAGAGGAAQVAVVVRGRGADLTAAVERVRPGLFARPAADGLRFTVLAGREGLGAGAGCPAIVLGCPAALLDASGTDRRRTSGGERRRARSHGEASTSSAAPLVFDPVDEVGRLASVVSKGVRRGRGLNSDRELVQACRALLAGGPAGHRELLWVALTAILENCIYAGESGRDGEFFTVPVLVALNALAQADAQFALPSPVADRVVETLRRAWGDNSPAALWPWRGWHKIAASPHALLEGLAFSAEGGDRALVADALRVCAALLPSSRGSSANLLLRYVGALAGAPESKAACAVPPLRRLPPLPADAGRAPSARLRGLDAELLLAAYDQSVHPFFLLVLQACLPDPPSVVEQHSLKALGDLVIRLSSSLSIRAIKAQAGGGGQDQTFRFMQFVEAAQAMPLGPRDEEEAKKRAAFNEDGIASGFACLQLTEQEKELLAVIQSVQRELQRQRPGALPPDQDDRLSSELELSASIAEECARRTGAARDCKRAPGGRAPSRQEARTAFLQLFGERVAYEVNVDGHADRIPVAVTVAGAPGRPVLVQCLDERLVEAFGSSKAKPYEFLESGPLHRAASARYLEDFAAPRAVVPSPPPVGFRWAFDQERGAQIRVAADAEGGALQFFVDGAAVPAFDASQLLEACNRPSAVVSPGPKFRAVLAEAFYASDGVGSGKGSGLVEPVGLLRVLDRVAALRGETGGDSTAVFDWRTFAASSSKMSAHVWRHLLVKLLTREGDVLEIFPVSKDGVRTDAAVQQMFEGTLLRVLYALQALYPDLVVRRGQRKWEIRWGAGAGAHLPHLLENVSLLAYGVYDDGLTLSPPAGKRRKAELEAAASPSVATDLWEHQAEARAKVLAGLREGQRGFADASAVGAGKTLTALSVIAGVAAMLSESGTEPLGSLVLVPRIPLIKEWIKEAKKHTAGFKLLEQRNDG